MHENPMTDSQRLAVIERIVTDMRDRLFGDDVDEGEIGHLKARVAKLEQWRWWIVGVAAAPAVGGVIAALVK